MDGKRNTVKQILSYDMIENYKRNIIEEGTIRGDYLGAKITLKRY